MATIITQEWLSQPSIYTNGLASNSQLQQIIDNAQLLAGAATGWINIAGGNNRAAVIPTITGTVSNDAAQFGSGQKTAAGGRHGRTYAGPLSSSGPITLAAVVQLDALSGVQVIVGNDENNSGGCRMQANGTSIQLTRIGNANQPLIGTPFLQAKVPYFFVISADSPTNQTVNYLGKNLLTGEITTGFLLWPGTYNTATAGAWPIGYGRATTESVGGVIDYALVSTGFASLQTLVAWAQNPWQIFNSSALDLIIPTAAGGTPTGTLAKTNANDTLAASGAQTNTGTLAKTNANDTLAGVGTQTNTGTVARTNANDTLAGVGFLSTTGTLATTNANDSLNAIGSGPAAPQASGGGGGGSTQNSRPDFGMSGRKLYEDAPKKKTVDVAAKKAVDAVIAKAQELAREKAALNALKEAQQREKQTKARLAKAAAMEAKVAEMEANLAILQDDEEVLQLFLKVLEH